VSLSFLRPKLLAAWSGFGGDEKLKAANGQSATRNSNEHDQDDDDYES